MFDAIDLFAGPGGWDVAARDLGLPALGFEADPAACATRRASGLSTVAGDLRGYSGPYAGIPGRTASPPCQTFSAAGSGAGRRALDTVLDLVRRVGRRELVDLTRFDDERTGLVLEPLVWTLTAIDHGYHPEWLAFEQVPAVLPVWEAMAEVLRSEGYSVATGKLSAEEFGVPQTRVRAFLVARLRGQARFPKPTHRKYRRGFPQDAGDPALKPWVSMADALGWGMTERPSMVRERDAGRWVYRTSTMPKATRRGAGEPAPTIAFGNDAASAGWESGSGFERITAEEAATLQTFPPDHQWRGSKTSIFQQIGNAVPPLLARAVLAEVTKP